MLVLLTIRYIAIFSYLGENYNFLIEKICRQAYNSYSSLVRQHCDVHMLCEWHVREHEDLIIYQTFVK